MKVIIADDSDLILERLQQMLSQHDKVQLVGSFKNGTQTLEALRTLKPDLAIVDIKMPGLNGLRVLKEIRKEDEALKFIILTFYATDYHRQLAIEAGADYFISKGDDFEKIPEIVEELILKIVTS